MKSIKAYDRFQMHVVMLIFTLSQVCAVTVNADQSDGAFYLPGESLYSALVNLKHINIKTVTGDEITPYEYKSYYKYDLKSKKLSKIDKRNYLNNADASPDGQWAVECIETKIDDNHMDVKYLLYSVNNPAKVMNLGNNDRHAWSPQRDSISYLACQPNCPTFEDCPYQYTCDAWIYNMKANSKNRLNVKAYDVSWPSFDNNLYFNLSKQWVPPKIVRYHPDTGKIDETPYQGLVFSPGGKYYLKDHYDTEPYYLYQREPNKELIEIEKQLDNQEGVHRYGSAIWLADGHSLILNARFVYDLDKMQFTKTMKEGAFLGFNKSKTHALFMTGVDQFKVVDLLSPDPAPK